ncbi:MAG: hypothetical protein K0R73_104 [Candidatus Midichloriaceae bacterium]|jgi:hypothetical protein|nr:hypothetical protein [Candidatus Midichloriaceae bacterium]
MLGVTSQGLSNSADLTFSSLEEEELLDQNFAAELSSALLPSAPIQTTEPSKIADEADIISSKIPIDKKAPLISTYENEIPSNEVKNFAPTPSITLQLAEVSHHPEQITEAITNTPYTEVLYAENEPVIHEVKHCNKEEDKIALNPTQEISETGLDLEIDLLMHTNLNIEKEERVSNVQDSIEEPLSDQKIEAYVNPLIKLEQPFVISSENKIIAAESFQDAIKTTDNHEKELSSVDLTKLTNAIPASQEVNASIKSITPEIQLAGSAPSAFTEQPRSKPNIKNTNVKDQDFSKILHLESISSPDLSSQPEKAGALKTIDFESRNQPVEAPAPILSEVEAPINNVNSITTTLPAPLIDQQHNTYSFIKQQNEAHVLEQIKFQVSKAITQDQQLIKFKLMPEDLGEIEVHFETNTTTGHTNISFFIERYQTLDIIGKIGDQIQASFTDSGFEAGSFSLNFGMQDKSNQEDNSSQPTPASIKPELTSATSKTANTFYMGTSSEAINILV